MLAAFALALMLLTIPGLVGAQGTGGVSGQPPTAKPSTHARTMMSKKMRVKHHRLYRHHKYAMRKGCTCASTMRHRAHVMKMHHKKLSSKVSRPGTAGGAGSATMAAGKKSMIMTGTVTGVMASRNEMMVKGANGMTYTVKMPSSASVMSNGHAMKLGSVKPGTKVRLTGQMTGKNMMTAKSASTMTAMPSGKGMKPSVAK
jgi:hypothetical protein